MINQCVRFVPLIVFFGLSCRPNEIICSEIAADRTRAFVFRGVFYLLPLSVVINDMERKLTRGVRGFSNIKHFTMKCLMLGK